MTYINTYIEDWNNGSITYEELEQLLAVNLTDEEYAQLEYTAASMGLSLRSFFERC